MPLLGASAEPRRSVLWRHGRTEWNKVGRDWRQLEVWGRLSARPRPIFPKPQSAAPQTDDFALLLPVG